MTLNIRERTNSSTIEKLVIKIPTTGKKVKSSDAKSEGIYPVIDQGEKIISGYVDDANKLLGVKGQIIVFGDHSRRIKLVNHDFVPGADGTVVLKPIEDINPQLLVYLMEYQLLTMRDNGYARHWQHLKKAVIKYPTCKSAQAQIVALISVTTSQIDDGLSFLEQAEKQIELYRQSVLKDAFEGKLTADWRATNPELVEPADKLLDRIEEERKVAHQAELDAWADAVNQWEASGKDCNKPTKPKAPHALPTIVDELSLFEDKIPKDWFLGTVGHLTNGVEYGSSSKSKKKGSYPVLRMGNLQSGELTWDELVFTDDEAEFKKYELNSGDILFNRTNSPELVGKSAIFRGEQSSLFAGYLIRVNQIDTICLPQFLNFFLNSSKAKQYGNLVKTDGVNQSNINGKKLLSYPIPICSIEEQKEIVLRIQKQFDAIKQSQDMFKKMSQQSSALKQSILKQAFSGYDLPKDVL